jgi:hypothetical protein
MKAIVPLAKHDFRKAVRYVSSTGGSGRKTTFRKKNGGKKAPLKRVPFKK